MSRSSDRLTPYLSRFTRLLFALFLCSLVTGCSNIIRSGLMNSNTVFLDPSMNRTAYLQLRNISENQNMMLAPSRPSSPRKVINLPTTLSRPTIGSRPRSCIVIRAPTESHQKV